MAASSIDVMALASDAGAGQDVGRSCVIVTVGTTKIMFDCGMHMGYRDERRFPDFSLLSAAGRYTDLISCVIITHFHLDHIGALPYFTETVSGFKGVMFKEGPKDEGPPNVVDNGGGEEQQDEEDEEFEVFETLDDNPMKIVPGLYLGSFMAEQNLDKLKTEGITHVLCVANDLDASHPDEFKYLQIMISDRPTSDLVTHFPKCFAFIDEAIEQQGSVLVHCMAGVSRSASVVIGYIMNKRGMKYEEVFSLVREYKLVKVTITTVIPTE
eukprot:gene9418-18407_t